MYFDSQYGACVSFHTLRITSAASPLLVEHIQVARWAPASMPGRRPASQTSCA
jgi:hypothetical protein